MPSIWKNMFNKISNTPLLNMDVGTRRIEEDMMELGEILNQAPRIAGLGSFKYDVIRNKLFLSKEVYEIYGINPLEFKKDIESVIGLIHLEDQPVIREAIEGCLAGRGYQIKLRIPQEKGGERTIKSNGSPMFDEQNQVVGVLGIIQDITENEILKKQLESNYKNLAESQRLAHIGSWEMDLIRNTSSCSEETYRIYGTTPEQFDGTFETFLKMVFPDDMDLVLKSLQSIDLEQPFELSYRIIRTDGSIHKIHSLIKTTFDDNSNPVFMRGVIHDVTEKENMQKQLDYSKRIIDIQQMRYEFLIRNAHDCFGIISSEGVILYCSDTSRELFGLDPGDIKGKSIFEYFEKSESEKMRLMLNSVLNDKNGHAQSEIVYINQQGEKVYIEVCLDNHIFDTAITGIVLNCRNITERKEIERKAEYAANHDELTKLPNYTFFEKQISIQCKESSRDNNSFTLMVININGIQYINDALGYKAGDEFIVEIAKRLKGAISEDAFLCRYSGNQFALILPSLHVADEYQDDAEKLATLFLKPFKTRHYELKFTVSIGVCIFPEDGDNPDLLKVHVNNALVRAKAKIKNSYVFYSPSMNIQNYKQFELRNSLVNAISEKQLDVYFQPLVNLKTNEILGAEALIQWNHPSWGMIMPDELIPIAEETGLIIDIENWMFREICETYARWMDEGRPAVKISVNYSIVNFYEKNFVENIKHTLEEFDLNPGFLIIEISDKIITGNQELILLNINSLQEVGIQVAFDNFGTEFSSFQYLSLFHIDILKLDDGFIKKAMVDRKSNIIVCNLVRMCRELEIKLAAIGIDTIEHLTYLKSLNFHTGQGYLYSKPIPGKEFEKMLYGKKLKIFQVKDTGIVQVERRMYFRIGFSNLLEGSMTISAIQTRKVKLGYTQVLIKDIGPGGLCFISNIKIPANHEIILNFRTVLLGKEIEVSGCPIWTEEFVGNLYTYGVQFNIEENERTPLTGILNKLQIAMKNNMEFSDGDFVCVTPMLYFSRN